MSVTGKRGVGVPVILMHDGEGTIVTVECKNGDTYRGFLDETEDNMNCILKDATRTDAKGNKTAVEHIFLRGSQIAVLRVPQHAEEGADVQARPGLEAEQLETAAGPGGPGARPGRGDHPEGAAPAAAADADAPGGAAPMMWPRSSRF